MAGAAVLIVEDDPTLARAVARNLDARGYVTRGAGTVAEALRALEDETPTLVLLDIDLPDGSGWEVLRALRSGAGYRTPVIVMSAFRPNARLIGELSCVGVLEKPFPMPSLVRLVLAQLQAPVDEHGEAPEGIAEGGAWE
jgi:two-component system KDP operon response regulator KdpE